MLNAVKKGAGKGHQFGGEWTTRKLEVLAGYLQSYTTALKDKPSASKSVESRKYRSRIDRLRCTEAQIKFLSLEPLLGPLHDLNLSGIDWVIVGGESGPKARPMDPLWVTDLRDQCRRAEVPFFFKQWGGHEQEEGGAASGWSNLGADAAWSGSETARPSFASVGARCPAVIGPETPT